MWIPNYITVSWLGRLGPIPWINNWPALTIPFYAPGAFSIFLLRQFFQQIPNELWDSRKSTAPGVCVICSPSHRSSFQSADDDHDLVWLHWLMELAGMADFGDDHTRLATCLLWLIELS